LLEKNGEDNMVERIRKKRTLLNNILLRKANWSGSEKKLPSC
jgi:hypothetical protein